MLPKLVDSRTITSSTSKVTFNVPPGKYRKAQLRFASTLDTGEGSNLVPADFGNFIYRENLPASKISVDFLDNFKQDVFGERMLDIDTDTLVDYVVDYYFHLPGDEINILWVKDGDNAKIELEVSNDLATRLAANQMTCELYLYEREGLSLYRLLYNTQDFDIVANTRSHNLQIENIAQMWFEYDTTLTNVLYRRDGQTVADAILNMFVHETAGISKRKAAFNPDSVTFGYLQIDNNERQNFLDMINDVNIVELTGSGTDSITFNFLHLDFQPRRFRESVADLDVYSQNQMNRKGRGGKNRALEHIVALSENGF